MKEVRMCAITEEEELRRKKERNIENLNYPFISLFLQETLTELIFLLKKKKSLAYSSIQSFFQYSSHIFSGLLTCEKKLCFYLINNS